MEQMLQVIIFIYRGLSGGKLKTNTNDSQSYFDYVFGADGFTVGSNNLVNGSGEICIMELESRKFSRFN